MHSHFTVTPEQNTPQKLELIEVADKSSTAVEQFSLIFHGPSDFLLPQKLYAAQHPKLGSMDLFLVPVGQTQDGYLYQVVFNRLKD
ncbi:hypothetical protein LOK74_16175 [Brevibacillus humidisoli]|uniref:DUF6916 family protein n=1 Tax=Brevibacillus humidisoli TaxID=2895522 RepID=UPI001E55FB35|nr:hypothetical protein [Brevibacillus humidisoli]UFJ39583.1 hypothetical protein LOK74_16175 [Brevibacillus humidisoli]